MYFMERTVAFSETAPDYGVKLTKLMDYFQDVTIKSSDELGVGVRELRSRGMCWVLSSMQVVVNRYPTLDEKILVGTAPTEFKGFMGIRNFLVKTIDGEILAMANSIWPFVDTEKMGLIRIPQFVVDTYETEAPLEMEYASRKIKLPADMTPLSPMNTQYHNLDINGHVNNAQYIAMAEDLVEAGRRCKQMRAEYRASAKLGDTIYPYQNISEDGKIITVSLADKDAKPYVVVEFTV